MRMVDFFRLQRTMAKVDQCVNNIFVMVIYENIFNPGLNRKL